MKAAILATIVATGFALTTPALAQQGGEPKGSPGGSERPEKGGSPGGSERQEKGGERHEERGERREERGERGGHERHHYHGRWYEYGEGECWNRVGPVFIWTCGDDD
jgi:hypothetical protein